MCDFRTLFFQLDKLFEAMDYDIRIIEWIKSGLKKPGKNSADLAASIGIPRNTIYKILSGGRSVQTRELPLIAAYLGEPLPLESSNNILIKKQPEYSSQPVVANAIGHVSHDLGIIPVLGHANGSKEAIMLNFDEPIGEVTSHPNQVGMRGAFALYARGDSMGYRYKDGELVYVIANKPPVRGQDCIVEMKNGESYLKEFDRRTNKEIICQQYKPEGIWKRKMEDVKALHAVVGRG